MTSMSINVLTHLSEQKNGLVKSVTGTNAMVNVWTVSPFIARAALGPIGFQLLDLRLATTSLDRASSLAPFLKMFRVNFLRFPVSFLYLATPLPLPSILAQQGKLKRKISSSVSTPLRLTDLLRHLLSILSSRSLRTTCWMNANPFPFRLCRSVEV